MTIVVGGYIVGFPLGGMTWHHLNYLLGLHELGHEVVFFEDSGDYFHPYDPTKGKCEIDPSYGIEYLKKTFADFGLPARWCYYSKFWDTHYGLTRDELHDVLRRADLMICVSGVTPMPADRPRARRTAVIDTDPVFTQLKMRENPALLDYYRSFDAVATFGRLIGTKDCPLPTHGINWIPTNQPVAMRHWPVVQPTDDVFTTVGKWEHSAERNLEFNGRRYHSSKGVEWMKVIDLPRHVSAPMHLGMQGMPDETRDRFASHGWRLFDPQSATLDCASFRSFIQHHAAEFTVTKEIYAGVPSGWFSDRGACYLASGRPVVMQASGFERWLPSGEGLFAFQTADEATQAIQQITSDFSSHSQAARRIAEKFFDSRRVLTDLLDRVL